MEIYLRIVLILSLEAFKEPLAITIRKGVAESEVNFVILVFEYVRKMDFQRVFSLVVLIMRPYAFTYCKDCTLWETVPRSFVNSVNGTISIGRLFVLDCEKLICEFTSEKSMWMYGMRKLNLTPL